MLFRSFIACLLASSDALRVNAVTRRSAVFGGAAVALPMQSAMAACLGKCADPDAERRAAERLAIQTGSAASTAYASNERFSDGVEGLIEKSIRNAEANNYSGTPLTDADKAAIAAKVRAMAPDTVTVRVNCSHLQHFARPCVRAMYAYGKAPRSPT